MAGESRFERPPRRGRMDDSGGDTEGGKKLYYHLTLLAENQTGYKNLIKLASLAYLEGYYYQPRVDWELLERHHEGLIATTGCLGGHVLQSMLAGDGDGALRSAARLRDIFGPDHLFVELQDHGIPAQRQTMSGLLDIATKLGSPVLATNDSHYVHRDDSMAHDASALRADRHDHRRPEALQVRGPRALPEDGGRDALSLPRASRCVRQHALGRRASGCADRVRQAPASRVPHPRRVRRRRRLPPPPRDGGSPPAVGRAPSSDHRRAHRLRAPGHHRHGVRRLLPHLLGPHPLRARARHPGRARAWQCGGLRRRVLPAHHRPRPDQVRPPVRALPQPRSHPDARHRHGLRRPVPRRDDPLRVRALRP